jgi:hypothetical protein
MAADVIIWLPGDSTHSVQSNFKGQTFAGLGCGVFKSVDALE